MAPTHARAQAPAPAGPARQTHPPQAGLPEVADQRPLIPVWRLFPQVLAAMVAGTIATGLIFAGAHQG